MAKVTRAPKIGRPALEFSISACRDQLIAPLLMPKPNWNSVDVAKFTGLSQSTISRTWQNTYPLVKTEIKDFHSLDLLAATVTHDGTYLLFEFAPTLETQVSLNEHFMRSTKRRAWQVMLATCLLSEKINSKPDYSRLVEFITKQTHENFVLICSSKLPAELEILSIKTVVINDAQTWQSCIHDLITNSNLTKQETLDQIQLSIMPWARNPKQNFYWQKLASVNDASANRLNRPRALNQVLSEQAFNLIMAELRSGRITSGDRITESYLAKHLHTSRNQARDAIKNLASSGLLEIENNKGAVIPTPRVSDVIDIYEARRALGAVIFRRAAQMPNSAFNDSAQVLKRMLELGDSGNAIETGLHDLLFQETVAADTGMRNFYEMFHDLASQLRLFIEILGLNYIYSIADMCSDNQALFKAVLAGDVPGATSAWNKKMFDAQEFAAKQIEIWRRQH